MYGALDISTSGMIAQRTRLDVISSNIVNKDTMVDADGRANPYRRREVFFAAGAPDSRSAKGGGLGVHVASVELDMSPLTREWDPSHPLAAKEGPDAGYVFKPNVNPVFEQINAMDAARAYEANVIAAEATKTMMAQALRLIA